MPAGTVSIAAAAGKKLHRLEKPFGDAGHLNYMPPGVALGHAHSLRAAAVCVNIFFGSRDTIDWPPAKAAAN
jgi:hypothetical protein